MALEDGARRIIAPTGGFIGWLAGETLAEIAHRFATPVASIAAANQRPIAHLEAGDTLVIPVSYAAPRTVARQPAARLPPATCAPRRRLCGHRAPVRSRPAGSNAAPAVTRPRPSRSTNPPRLLQDRQPRFETSRHDKLSAAYKLILATRQKVRSWPLPSEENELF